VWHRVHAGGAHLAASPGPAAALVLLEALCRGAGRARAAGGGGAMITPPYRILTYRGYRGLLCLACNRFSWNINDVKHRYCGFCHVFLNELPELLRQDEVEGKAPGFLLAQEG
jgi:hypothetical protein